MQQLSHSIGTMQHCPSSLSTCRNVCLQSIEAEVLQRMAQEMGQRNPNSDWIPRSNCWWYRSSELINIKVFKFINLPSKVCSKSDCPWATIAEEKHGWWLVRPSQFCFSQLCKPFWAYFRYRYVFSYWWYLNFHHLMGAWRRAPGCCKRQKATSAFHQVMKTCWIKPRQTVIARKQPAKDYFQSSES